MSTQTLIRLADIVQSRLSNGNEPAAHIVTVPEVSEAKTPQARVLEARLDGFEVTALCGHTWNPQPVPEAAPCLRALR